LIRAVIDTNVLASGIFWKGTPLKVIEAWTDGKIKLIVSGEILIEYERVLTILNKKAQLQNFDQILELINLNAELVNPVAFTRPVCRDKDDDKFLAAALGGNAQYIVTGDDDLLVLNGHQGLKIMKPKEFLGQLK
jgi:putative PIN family toxin of toxin-antitoxin system